MVKILSYGGGVNSTAILALVKAGELEAPDYVVFSDTGAEWPHTYKYLEYMELQGVRFIYLTGGSKEKTLIDYCNETKNIPSRVNRWCTDYWKRIPVGRFARSFGEYEMWIGIDAGETNRATNRKVRKEGNRFPLIELGIEREGCKAVIRQAGWGVPQKSGCFLCPYQRVIQWITLKRDYPDLWRIAEGLEMRARRERPNFTLGSHGRTINEVVAGREKQKTLDLDFNLDQRCECYFD